MKLDRPIFIVGHARGGTTLLAAIINWHSQVGPRHRSLGEFNDINGFLASILGSRKHLDYSEYLEKKEVWFDYFPGKDVFTHMGRELIVEELVLDDAQIDELVSRLIVDFRQERFLCKAPTNSFRVKVIPKIFPGAKVIAVYRDGPSVVSSWGQRSYGFGKPVFWGKERHIRLGYRTGIKIFARKWNETLEYLESCREQMGFMAVRYSDLVENTSETLEKLMNYLELPVEDYIYRVKLKNRNPQWKEKVPRRYHRFLLEETEKGRKFLEAIGENDT